MKNILPYLAGLLVAALIVLVIVSANRNGPKKFDQRVTLRQQDKIPYGTSVAKRLLPEMFPAAEIYYDHNHPGYWDSVAVTSYNQAVILMSKNFEAEQYELERLMDFVENGNYVFIVAKSFSGDARRLFHFSYATDLMGDLIPAEDSLGLQLNTDYFSTGRDFVFPGKKYDSWFTSIDTAFTHQLGTDRDGRPNFIRINKGSCSLLIHAAPAAFSNYFILHRDNYLYYEKVMSVIPGHINSILWNDYYMDKQAARPEKKKNWLSVLFRYESFKWGLLTAIITLLLFVLLGSRRRQRMIPPYSKPKNDSLDFVKTMGRLYHEKRDHTDLAGKMSVYFREQVRSVYNLSTQNMDEEFIRSLHVKSGYPVASLTEIVSFINQLDRNSAISEHDLSLFHRQLELFYQKT